jgi:hypothetical protein
MRSLQLEVGHFLTDIFLHAELMERIIKGKNISYYS